MKKLPGVMLEEDLLNGFPTSHMMCNRQFPEAYLRPLNISKGHNAPLPAENE